MILIRAGRVLGPAEGLDIKADVVLDGDRIAGIFPADQGGAEGAPGFSTRERQYEQIIEAEGLAAAPGLVDVHVHFRDPGPTGKGCSKGRLHHGRVHGQYQPHCG